ncbi:hypothetical protein [Pleomorphomonas sp. PLEO]|uniref:hypothetical protein n=1 Tax=Pleomorphomonas sp. PLEO TaxID=3239306 RepID=UPI00351DAFC4
MTDDQALAELFHQVKAGASMFTRRMAITLADMFGMEPLPMVARLERVGLLKPGSEDWFRIQGGITAAHIKQVREETAAALERRP